MGRNSGIKDAVEAAKATARELYDMEGWDLFSVRVGRAPSNSNGHTVVLHKPAQYKGPYAYLLIELDPANEATVVRKISGSEVEQENY